MAVSIDSLRSQQLQCHFLGEACLTTLAEMGFSLPPSHFLFHFPGLIHLLLVVLIMFRNPLNSVGE